MEPTFKFISFWVYIYFIFMIDCASKFLCHKLISSNQEEEMSCLPYIKI
ncbi:hypothetical protein MNBD_GAMMA07-2741 [hydrothermal vent metagenome]|uniref:Uncharacterized protein n=1 Tax=hydrothermal vent metagenome TaxID=652676 RepID=A0A3B0X0I2_9ZZZZ